MANNCVVKDASVIPPKTYANLFTDLSVSNNVTAGSLTLPSIANSSQANVLHYNTGTGVVSYAPGGGGGGGASKAFFWGVRTNTLSVLQNSNTQIPFVQINASSGDWTVVGGNSLRYDGATTKTFSVEALACLQYAGMTMVDGTFYLQIRRNTGGGGIPLATGSGVVNVVNIGSPVETVMARSVTIMNTNDVLTFFATCNGSDANMLDVSFSAGGTTYSSEPCTILVSEIS